MSKWDREYIKNMKGMVDNRCKISVCYILVKNIICGNALTMEESDGTPITFSEWSLVRGTLIKRRDFALNELLSGHTKQKTLDMTGWQYDNEINGLIPLPIKEYPLADYRRIMEYD